MVSSENMSSLALFLEKQGAVRRLNEELEQLKSSQTVDAAIRIKHEIEALMADYELSPEQLLEAVCLLFDLAKPVGFVGSDLTGQAQESDGQTRASDPGRIPKVESASAESDSPVTSQKKSANTKGSSKGGRSQRMPANQSMVPAKRVTILTTEQRQARASSSSAPAQSQTAKKSGGRNKSADKIIAPARRQQALKIYTNPHNGEVVKTRGANHRVLNQWRVTYGDDAVEGWGALEDDNGSKA